MLKDSLEDEHFVRFQFLQPEADMRISDKKLKTHTHIGFLHLMVNSSEIQNP